MKINIIEVSSFDKKATAVIQPEEQKNKFNKKFKLTEKLSRKEINEIIENHRKGLRK